MITQNSRFWSRPEIFWISLSVVYLFKFQCKMCSLNMWKCEWASWKHGEVWTHSKDGSNGRIDSHIFSHCGRYMDIVWLTQSKSPTPIWRLGTPIWRTWRSFWIAMGSTARRFMAERWGKHQHCLRTSNMDSTDIPVSYWT